MTTDELNAFRRATYEILPARGPTPSRRPRSPRPLEPVLMEARHRHGAASPQPRRWPR
jgi:hypothetical protein